MSARAATQAASYSKGLVLAVLVDGNKLSLRELVLCFVTCKTFREVLDGRGFCIGTAWLCAYLESGRSPAEILSRLRSARRSVANERPLSRVDQVTSFLMRHDTYRVRWGWAWAQLLYQEPDGGVLCEGVKKMLWMLKGRLIKELHKCSGYYPGLCSLTGHSGRVYSVAWSPDGRLVASGSSDETIRIFDVVSGSGKCFLMGHSGFVHSVAWSPCGNFVASGSWDGTIKIWDVVTGSEKCSLTGHSSFVHSVAWSPCGNFVASGSWDGTIKIWDVVTGSEKCSLTGHSGSVNSVAWSPCGKFVASGSSDKTIKIWHAETGKEKCSLTGHSGDVNSVAWSPCGKFVASGSGDKIIKIWHAETGSEKCSLKGHSGNPESSVKCLAAMQSYFMHENYYPFVGDEGGWMELDDDGLISKGHLKQLLLDRDLNLGQEDIEALDVESLFAYLLTLDESQGESVRKDVFNKALEEADTSAITYNPNPRLKCTLRGHSGEVKSVAWSPNGKTIVSGGDDGTVRLWDVETGSEKCSLTGHSYAVSSVAWSPDGKLVASGSGDSTRRIWDAATGMETMAPLMGLPSSWVDVGPEIRALAQQVGQASGDLMACAGNYVVTAYQDTVLINKVLEGRERDDESGDEQETEPVAMFRCPNEVHAVACRPPYICAGCEGGQVLLLEAPFLCEGPGI